ncbi:MAG: hypothetical protein PUD50_07985 [Eubacteriales bacterium]|nr:hypothetical protein [Eubacteriales bacterium]
MLWILIDKPIRIVLTWNKHLCTLQNKINVWLITFRPFSCGKNANLPNLSPENAAITNSKHTEPQRSCVNLDGALCFHTKNDGQEQDQKTASFPGRVFRVKKTIYGKRCYQEKDNHKQGRILQSVRFVFHWHHPVFQNAAGGRFGA